MITAMKTAAHLMKIIIAFEFLKEAHTPNFSRFHFLSDACVLEKSQ